jgi:hypothetical protein
MTALTMRADGKQLVGTKADVSALLGSWVNAKPESDNIPKLEVTERDGELVVRLYGATDEKPLDWGEAVATPYVASGTTDVSGFVARYELGPVHTELAGNVKQGILVIQSYTSFHDGSDRVPHYAREFFYQSPAGGVRSVGKGVGSLLGEWTNSYSETSWRVHPSGVRRQRTDRLGRSDGHGVPGRRRQAGLQGQLRPRRVRRGTDREHRPGPGDHRRADSLQGGRPDHLVSGVLLSAGLTGGRRDRAGTAAG